MFLGHNNDEDTYYRSYDLMLALLFLLQAPVHLCVRVYFNCFHQPEAREILLYWWRDRARTADDLSQTELVGTSAFERWSGLKFFVVVPRTLLLSLRRGQKAASTQCHYSTIEVSSIVTI
ncbi:hypothetical protein NXS19_011380 [Fusarium pseudograminearum]|nr:hypothetical protein NXS19_011380 [Fusarium pseudograminearum]